MQLFIVKISTFCYKLAPLAALLLLLGCEPVDHTIDERFLWVGYYQVTETAQDAFSGLPSEVYYELSIGDAWGSTLEVELVPVNGALYGTNCSLIGNVFTPEELSIPPQICDLGPGEYLEISGFGEIDPNGCCALIELTIDHCLNGFCVPEPAVYLELQKL